MIVCPSCSNESPDEALFCGYCGTKLSSERPKNTIFGLAAIPEVKPQAKDGDDAPVDLGAPRDVPRDSVDEGWDVADDDDDLGRPTVQTPALDADTLADELSAVELGVTLSHDEDEETQEQEAREREAQEREVREREREVREREARERREEQERQAREQQARRKEQEQKAQEARAKEQKKASQSSSKSAYPAPVSGKTDKAGEEEFFGATLSQYGLAPAVDKPYISDEEIGSELKRANRSGLFMVLLALLVLGLIIGAIAVFVIYGKPDG